MSTKIASLRRKHPRFIYESFKVKRLNDDLKIGFKFKIEPDLDFTPEIIIKNINQSEIDSLDKATINNLAFHLGLMETLSYWKATCSPEIIIKSGFLNQEQVSWWKKILLNGMGQFFYTNKIDFTQSDFVTFKVNPQAPTWERNQKLLLENKSLVLVSGGKDSAVTLHVLGKEKEIGCLLLNPQPAALEITNHFKPSQTIIVKREIDPRLLRLNQKGYLNGHTPFSAYLAFLGTTMAVFFNYGSVIASNERSAEEENLVYLEKKINHQYSKTFQFENLFAQYAKQYLTKNFNYFSLLRPLWELQVTKLFSEHPQHFPVFRSCNVGQKTNTWCHQCPKCLSTFLLLYPFLEEKQLGLIFGKNLFKEKSLLPILQALIGKSDGKPFECVATYKETLVALYLGFKKAQKEKQIPDLLKFFQKEVLPERNNWEKMATEILTSWNDQHCLPSELAKMLKKKIRK